jgi:hypothetical protein
MKKVKLLFSLFLVAGTSTFFSCEYNIFTGCHTGDSYDFVYGNPFPFNILDKETGENVLHIGQINYNYDTVKVYHENWDVAYPGPVHGDGLVILYILRRDTDRNVINERISKTFFHVLQLYGY